MCLITRLPQTSLLSFVILYEQQKNHDMCFKNKKNVCYVSFNGMLGDYKWEKWKDKWGFNDNAKRMGDYDQHS